MSLVSALDKLMGQGIKIRTKDRKTATMYLQVSQKGLYLKITRGKKSFVALVPKNEMPKLLAPIIAEFVLQPNEIDKVWKYIVKAKKQGKKEVKKKESEEEELELL